MLMKKPMIVVNPGKQLYFDYAKGSGALVAHNSKELSEKISSVLNNPITTVRLLKNAEKTKAIENSKKEAKVGEEDQNKKKAK